MKLVLERYEHGENYTCGKLSIDGEFFCYTLEDAGRMVKIYGETCIPTGTYKVTIDYSNRFKQDMPHVLDVVGFAGIRIHSGNTDKDTEGCILLGLTHDSTQNFVGQSKKAYNKFFPLLRSALDLKEIVTLEIKNAT